MVNGRDETWIRTPLASTGECKFPRGRRAPGHGREAVVVASEMVRNHIAEVITTIRGTNGNAGSAGNRRAGSGVLLPHNCPIRRRHRSLDCAFSSARPEGDYTHGTTLRSRVRRPGQSRLFGSIQYSSFGLMSTSGIGSNLLSSSGGMSGSGAPRAARCAFAFSRPNDTHMAARRTTQPGRPQWGRRWRPVCRLRQARYLPARCTHRLDGGDSGRVRQPPRHHRGCLWLLPGHCAS